MTKRTITFQSKNYKGLEGKTVAVKYDTPIFKLRETHLKTDLGYFDVTISLDKRGRLNAVLLEKTRGHF